MALLALIAGQDVEPVEGSDGTDGRWRIAQQVAADRVISTVDPDTRHAHKTVHRRQDGFKAHLAVEPDTGIITDCALTKASGAGNREALVGLALLEGEDPAVHGTRPTLPTAQGRFALALAEPATSVGSSRSRCAPPRGGFTQDDFTRRPRRGQVRAGRARLARSPARIVTFGVACANCPVRARCTPRRAGGNYQLARMTLLYSPRRQAAQDPDWPTFTASTGPWSNVPSPGSSVATALRYRGVTKTITGCTTEPPRSTYAD